MVSLSDPSSLVTSQINFCGGNSGDSGGIPNKVNTTVKPVGSVPSVTSQINFCGALLWGFRGDNKGGLEPIRANSLLGV